MKDKIFSENSKKNGNRIYDEIIIYQPDSTLSLDVRVEDDTVWLSQAQMAELFMRDRTVITRHINNIFKEQELDESCNVHFLHIPNSDKPVKLYSRRNFHIGASIKDLGKKLFAFSKMEIAPDIILNTI